jgi:hypothetical protein
MTMWALALFSRFTITCDGQQHVQDTLVQKLPESFERIFVPD